MPENEDKVGMKQARRSASATEQHDDPLSSSRKPWRFWAVFPGLCLCNFLTSFDASVAFTALPTIVSDLQSGENYIWIINAYTLAMTAVQPLYGQLANLFGRKVTLIIAIGSFLGGSLICALSKTTLVLIIGRAVQGVGGGGLSVLPGLIICDLVPLRERQKYTGVTYSASAIGTLIGPVLGGSFAESVGWRWIFYLALIIGAMGLGLVILFLRLEHGREGTLLEQLRQIDVFGNLLLTASIASILLSLTWAGSKYSWKSSPCIAPLTCGFGGLVLFIWSQRISQLCPVPTVPLRLFQNTTSLLAFAMTLNHGLLLFWSSLSIPLYFQAVLLTTPKQSGVNSLPMAIACEKNLSIRNKHTLNQMRMLVIPCGILGGFLIAKTGRYKINLVAGFSLMLLAQGLFSTLDQESRTARWIGFQILSALGAGLVLTALLPAIQAPLPEEDTAASAAMWGFIQSFGFIWGAAIPSAVFNSRSSSLIRHSSHKEVRVLLQGGTAYDHATRAFLATLSDPTRTEARRIFSNSVQFTWLISLVFGACGFLFACVIPEIPLRTNLDTKYGLEDETSKKD